VGQSRVHTAAANSAAGLGLAALAVLATLATLARGARCRSKVKFHVHVVSWFAELERCVFREGCVLGLAREDVEAELGVVEAAVLAGKLVHEELEVGLPHGEVEVLQSALEVVLAALPEFAGVVELELLHEVVQGQGRLVVVLPGAGEVAHLCSDSLGDGPFGNVEHVVIGCVGAHGLAVQGVLEEHALARSEGVLLADVDLSAGVIRGTSLGQEFVDCENTISIGIVLVEELLGLLLCGKQSKPHQNNVELTQVDSHNIVI